MIAAPLSVERLPVRALAELWREGDLHLRFDAHTSARDGIATHGSRPLPPDARREVTVRGRFSDATDAVDVHGRIDAVHPGVPVVIEELKVTRSDAARLHAHAAAVHWAQVRLYGHLLSLRDGLDRWRLRLTYRHPDSGEELSFDRDDAAADAQAFFADTCARRIAWARALRTWRAGRDASLAALRFPFTEYRAGQRSFAGRCFRAVRDRAQVALEAPTGLGKSVAALFGALHALAAGHADRIVFLTARTTGRRAAVAAADRLIGQGAALRYVEIGARASVCLSPGSACTGEDCSWAAGHYDRVAPALDELAALCTATTAVVDAVARRHHVCPFALSIAASRAADLIVCDYHYVLDPQVSPSAITDEAERTVLLIDEAHRVAERGHEIFSASLVEPMLLAVARDGDASLRRAARRVLRNLRATSTGDVGAAEPASAGDRLDGALADFIGVCERRFAGRDADGTDAISEAWFAAVHWQRSIAWSASAPYVRLLVDVQGRASLSDGREPAHRHYCVDPAPLLAARMRAFGAVAAFSGTLPGAPPPGLAGAGHVIRFDSPFPPERLGVFIVDDIDVRARAREATIDRVAQSALATVAARAGGYLLYAPSFAYLSAIAAAIARHAPEVERLEQAPRMDAAARTAFLAQLCESNGTRIAMAITGGVFGESIDLPPGTLAGIVIVGIALPPPSLEREAIRYHRPPDGAAIAYRLPALIRVRQTAGRLIRSEHDAGVLVLIDPRFAGAAGRRDLPGYWRPQVLRSASLRAAIDRFWDRLGA